MEQPPLGRPVFARPAIEQGSQCARPERRFTLLDKEGLPQSNGQILEGSPGRGPRNLVLSRAPEVRQPCPEDRRTDRVAALGCPAGILRKPLHPGRLLAGSNRSLVDRNGLGDSLGFGGLDRGHDRLIGSTGRPRSGKQGWRVDIVREHRPDRFGMLDRGEEHRQHLGLEERQLEKNRSEDLIGRMIGHRPEEQAILPQHVPRLVELGIANVGNSLGNTGRANDLRWVGKPDLADDLCVEEAPPDLRQDDIRRLRGEFLGFRLSDQEDDRWPLGVRGPSHFRAAYDRAERSAWNHISGRPRTAEPVEVTVVLDHAAKNPRWHQDGRGISLCDGAAVRRVRWPTSQGIAAPPAIDPLSASGRHGAW